MKGMRCLLLVFNHCGFSNPLFLDVLERQSESAIRAGLHRRFPIDATGKNYDTFVWLFGDAAVEHLRVISYTTDKSAHWTKLLKLDGWRLDVADGYRTLSDNQES